MGLFGDLISALTTPTQSMKIDYTWLLFGAKGSGKHEFLATIAQEFDCVEGSTHAKDFEDEWQKSFQTEIDNDDDSNGSVELNLNCLLLEPDSNEPHKMVDGASRFTKKINLFLQDRVFPCFFINLEKFFKNEEAELQLLFAHMLFYWRFVYSVGKHGHYECDFDSDMMEAMNDDIAWGEMPRGFSNFYIFATHLDKVSVKGNEAIKKKFSAAVKKMEGKVSRSVFGELFDDFDKKTEGACFYVDLFHAKMRKAAFAHFMQITHPDEE